MTTKWLKFDVISSLFGIAIGFVSFSFIFGWRQRQEKKAKSDILISNTEHGESLHWNPLIERRGLGDCLTKLNHIAITVSDVGKSLHFYVDILGLQQIRRPSFDRHGAWLTMGNIELHLIKGLPTIPSVDNLQVAHLAFETLQINEVVHKLHKLNIGVRQSLSVTNAHKSISNGKPVVIQYFFNDPDGYYIELCNCDVLSDFSFNRNPIIDHIDYHEGVHNEQIFFVIQAISHWKRKTRKYSEEEFDEILKKVSRASEVDENKFNNLVRRRSIYGDITQGFSHEEIKEALLQTNNFVPLTVKFLARKRGERIFFRPPSFIENEELVAPEPFIMNRNEFN
jgi:catechol 2,3-dioxygenase-like lactoylglutathione lyase family enzyme